MKDIVPALSYCLIIVPYLTMPGSHLPTSMRNVYREGLGKQYTDKLHNVMLHLKMSNCNLVLSPIILFFWMYGHLCEEWFALFWFNSFKDNYLFILKPSGFPYSFIQHLGKAEKQPCIIYSIYIYIYISCGLSHGCQCGNEVFDYW